MNPEQKGVVHSAAGEMPTGAGPPPIGGCSSGIEDAPGCCMLTPSLHPQRSTGETPSGTIVFEVACLGYKRMGRLPTVRRALLRLRRPDDFPTVSAEVGGGMRKIIRATRGYGRPLFLIALFHPAPPVRLNAASGNQNSYQSCAAEPYPIYGREARRSVGVIERICRDACTWGSARNLKEQM